MRIINVDLGLQYYCDNVILNAMIIIATEEIF